MSSRMVVAAGAMWLCVLLLLLRGAEAAAAEDTLAADASTTAATNSNSNIAASAEATAIPFDRVGPQQLSSGSYAVLLTMEAPTDGNHGLDELRAGLASFASVPEAALEVTSLAPTRVRVRGVGPKRSVCNALVALTMRLSAMRKRFGVVAVALLKQSTSRGDVVHQGRHFQALNNATSPATSEPTTSSIFSATTSIAPATGASTSYSYSPPYTYTPYSYSPPYTYTPYSYSPPYTYTPYSYSPYSTYSYAPATPPTTAPAGNASTAAAPTLPPTTTAPAATSSTAASPVATQPAATAPPAMTIAMSARIRIAGSAFALLLNGGPATSQRLVAAVRADIGSLLDVDASTVFITDMYLGSLVVDFSVAAAAAANSSQLNDRLVMATNATTWLASTQAVYSAVSNEQLSVTDVPVVVRSGSGIRYSTADTPAPILASPSPADSPAHNVVVVLATVLLLLVGQY